MELSLWYFAGRKYSSDNKLKNFQEWYSTQISDACSNLSDLWNS